MIPTYADIPDSLKNQAQWVCWRAEPRGPKITKIPVNARTGAPASVTNPADWSTFDEAVEAAQSRGWSGIGLVLTEGSGLVGVDLDDALGPNGQVEPRAARIVQTLASYTERSPSGRGLRVFVKGTLPGTKRRKDKVELYDRARYLTVTGNRLTELGGTPLPANVEERQVEVEGIHREVFPEDHSPKQCPKPVRPALEASDAEIIDKAKSARNGVGERFAKLWGGEWEGMGFPSQSEADACLLGSLRFWTGGDKARAIRLFGQSGLVREKWGREDYRAKTWAAIDHGEVYRPIARTPPASPSRKDAPPNPAPMGGDAPTASTEAAFMVDDILDRVRGNHTPSAAFPVDAIPPVLRELVVQGSAALGVDPAFIALPALAATGAAIGNSRRVVAKEGWAIPPVLWTVVVASSGELKTPSLEAALCGLHRQEQREYFRYKQELTKYSALKKEAEQRRRHNDEDAEIPEEPKPVRYIVRDTTVEGLAVLLHDNPRGLILEKDELAGWLGNFDRYSGGAGGEVAQWLEFHQAGKVTVDRKTGDKKLIHIPSAFVAVTGTIQPAILKRLLGQKNFENGLAARFFLAMPDSRPRKWTEAVLPEAVRDQAADLFGRLLSLQLNVGTDGEIAPVLVPLSPEAKVAWVEFYNRHNAEAATLGEERLKSAWSKLEGTLLRFALIHATVREVLNPTGALPMVDREAVEAGILLVEYGKEQVRRVYAMLSESEADAQLRRVVQFFQDHPEESFTARELTKGPPYLKPDRQAELLALLTSGGFLSAEESSAKGSKGGRRCLRYRLSEVAKAHSRQAGAVPPAPPETPIPRYPETQGETGNRANGEPGEAGEEFREEL